MNFHNNKRIVIAIDGFSSCGKSSFAKEIATKLGYVFIDTGAMYRAVTLYAMESGVISNGAVNESKLISLLNDINISFKFNSERGASDVYLNGIEVEQEIRTLEVSNNVSAVSGISEVRTKLVTLQQQMGEHRGVVMDGRDIGTVVFPDAELKIFMTAEVGIRAQRRYLELQQKNKPASLEEITENVSSRDKADLNRAVSPLCKADDAEILDNSYMTIPEQMDWINERLAKLLN